VEDKGVVEGWEGGAVKGAGDEEGRREALSVFHSCTRIAQSSSGNSASDILANGLDRNCTKPIATAVRLFSRSNRFAHVERKTLIAGSFRLKY
jgi:hypothetical protein